jgi:hypothetical protein
MVTYTANDWESALGFVADFVGPRDLVRVLLVNGVPTVVVSDRKK